jgi:hypothetical protein
MVILTRNEILHARCWPSVDLVVVTEIVVEGRDTDHPVATGGVAHLCQNWIPAEEDLTPLGYDYVTGLGGLAASASWVTVA